MAFTPAKVTIDLEEYQYLKDRAKFRIEQEYNFELTLYKEAFSAIHRDGRNLTALIQAWKDKGFEVSFTNNPMDPSGESICHVKRIPNGQIQSRKL